MTRSIFLPLDLNTSKYWEVFFRIRGQYSPMRELELDLFTYPSSYIIISNYMYILKIH